MKIVQCKVEDIDKLLDIGKETYSSSFGKYCSGEVMEAYLEEAFTREKLLSELNNRNSFFFFIYGGEHLAGYLKLNINEAQSDLKDRNALEIERIYVKNDFKGKGIGRELLRKSLAMAKEWNKDFVWLGVWEKNEPAMAFYRKNGFTEMGTHSFRMGHEIQNDFLMKRDL